MFESSFIADESTVERKNNDGTLILMKMDDSNTFFKVNGIAADIWAQLKTATKASVLLSQIVSEYEVTEEKARADVQNLISTLLAKNLIKKV